MCALTSFIKDFSPMITMFGTLTAFYFAIDGMLYRKKAEKESQAKLVSGWLIDTYDLEQGINGCLYTNCLIINGSESLLYNVIVRVVKFDDQSMFGDETARFFRGIGLLPPGKGKFRIEHPGHGMSKQYNIEIAFSDSSNRHWIRFGNGKLKELDVEPLEYYKIGRPYTWSKDHLNGVD